MTGFERIGTESFVRASTRPSLGDDEIHVWRSADASATNHREAAAAAHARLHALLEHYAASDRKLDIVRNERGKPHAPQSGLDFNLSHARDHALIAFARRQPIGVDLESTSRRVEIEDLARRFFSSGEADALSALPASLRPAAFLRLWTCKEAVLKAIGQGLSFGLDRVAFGLDDQGVPTGIAGLAAEAGPAEDWRIVLLEPVAGFLGALAWHGAPRKVRCFLAGSDA